MSLKTLNNIGNISNKKVIVRVDFNVPLNAEGNVKNDKRIKHAIPTIEYLLEKKVSQIILITHIGRPKNNEESLKTGKVAKYLSDLINEEVLKVDGWGEDGLPDDKIIMLENIRFNSSEKSKNEDERDAFGRKLASLADFYINEAFSNSHRKHASMTSIPKYIPAYAGFGVEDEVNKITDALESPEHPLIAIIAGLKEDKLLAIKHLLNIADVILVGGALAYSLIKSQGYSIGKSKIDNEGMEEMVDLIKIISHNKKVILPVDALVADDFNENANIKNVSINNIENDWMALDIGQETIKNYIKEIKKAKTILWFGPVGVFEMKPFSNGSIAIGNAIADSDAFSIVGGGDTASIINQLAIEDKISLISTGGGASLNMIEGKCLPALDILKKN